MPRKSAFAHRRNNRPEEAILRLKRARFALARERQLEIERQTRLAEEAAARLRKEREANERRARLEERFAGLSDEFEGYR